MLSYLLVFSLPKTLVFSSFSQIPCKCHILLSIILMLNLKLSACSLCFSSSFVWFLLSNFILLCHTFHVKFNFLFNCHIFSLYLFHAYTFLFFTVSLLLLILSSSQCFGLSFVWSCLVLCPFTLTLSLALLTGWILLSWVMSRWLPRPHVLKGLDRECAMTH